MREILEWLASMERLAAEVYEAAARRFRDDDLLRSFLEALAEDEHQHAYLIERVLPSLRGDGKVPRSAIILDAGTREAMEAPLLACQRMLDHADPSRAGVLRAIVDTEFTEYNHVFLYMMDLCKAEVKAVEQVAAVIQEHLRRIEAFLSGLPATLRPERTLTALQPLWERRILVVDDEPSLRELVCGVLTALGRVECCADGEDALRKVCARHYDAVLADAHIPAMGGEELYFRTVQEDPFLASRFMMMSGSSGDEAAAFCERHQIPHVAKPFTIPELQGAVERLFEGGR